MRARLRSLLQLQALDRMPRTGWIQRGVRDPESVAAHSFGVATLALALGPTVEPPLEVDRAVSLALSHDLGEAVLGDLPRGAAALFPPGAKRAAERAALADLLDPLAPLARERAEEALAEESREARFVKLLDGLQLGLRLLAYRRSGQAGLEEFQEGLRALDCSAFPPCEEFRAELLAALEELDG